MIPTRLFVQAVHAESTGGPLCDHPEDVWEGLELSG